ncbi:hypothetical protein AV530_010811 [Patagioenas fasciata monilis]|uniref:Uncharacterized protein n=1 Tax=Patagioenas fasciata monilis TaxID=372326 RepID=A0A1V4K7S8_PATFA|nr:hypothetical protein AV530_010811 [Patagioenas fasciata monilis]
MSSGDMAILLHRLVNMSCALAHFYLPSSENLETRSQAGGSTWLSLKSPNKSYLLPPPRDINRSSRVLSPAAIESCGGREGSAARLCSTPRALNCLSCGVGMRNNKQPLLLEEETEKCLVPPVVREEYSC